MIEAKGYNGTARFDGATISIGRAGFVGRLSIGKGEKRIPLRSVSSVQLKPAGAFINGFISFGLPGGVEKQSRFGSQSATASRDENAVMFKKKQQPAFEALRDAVEGAINASSNSAMFAASSDSFEQLKKLAELKDSGILSEEEFAAKKAELLSRM